MIEVKIGDSRKLIKDLPDKSVDCVMTSPPYWGLRDYGHTAVILLDGISGCYALERVREVEKTCWFPGAQA